MKKPPSSPEFQRFTEAMQKIMKVPKSAIPKHPTTPKTHKVK